MIRFVKFQITAFSVFSVLIIVQMLTSCAETEPTEPVEPSLPSIDNAIHVTIRSSLLGSSTGVLQLKNRTEQKLDVFLSMENKDSRQSDYHSVLINPYKMVEVGRLEGWVWVPNETVRIYCEGFDSTTYKTYRTKEGAVGIKRSWFLW
jgi:hypothetical protein